MTKPMLSVCPSCSRHVRESACPFCGAKVVAAPPIRVMRASRVALVGAAAVVSACGVSAQPLYGAPYDASQDDQASQKDAADESIGTFYGGPPLDSGKGDSGTDSSTDSGTGD